MNTSAAVIKHAFADTVLRAPHDLDSSGLRIAYRYRDGRGIYRRQRNILLSPSLLHTGTERWVHRQRRLCGMGSIGRYWDRLRRWYIVGTVRLTTVPNHIVLPALISLVLHRMRWMPFSL